VNAWERAALAGGRRLLSWAAGRVEPDLCEWIEAMRAELPEVEGAGARWRWTLGALWLVLIDRRLMAVLEGIRWSTVLKTCSFGLALGAVLLVGIVWSNVVQPSNESDDEYTAAYAVFYILLLGYFGLAGFVAARVRRSLKAGIVTGAATALVFAIIVLTTFVVIDNLFLDIVMKQPDKANGFARSGLHSARDYVNQGNFAFLIVVPVITGLGALMGTFGGMLSTIPLRVRAR
jgi:hypothetical protein